MAVQFLLGLGVGYTIARAAKYIIALVIFLLLGTLLGFWSLGNSLQDILVQTIGSVDKVWSLIYTLITGLGIVSIGPSLVGFIIGILLALRK